MKTLLSIIALLALGACASATPPTITEADIAAAEAEYARIDALPDASAMDLPSGAVVYSGQLGGDVIVDGDTGYAILADVRMTSDFDTGAVSGTMTNTNLIESGTPDQLLGGELTIAGGTSGTDLDVLATGTLTAVSDDAPVRGSANMTLDLDGRFVMDGADTAIAGTWTGSSSGGDFTVSGNGEFYAH